MRVWRVAVSLAMIFTAAPAALAMPDGAATATAGAEEYEEILVVGFGDKAFSISADQLRDAARAYQRHRAEFAPDGALTWKVLPGPNSSLEGLSFRLVKGDDQRDVAITGDGHAELPLDLLVQGGWILRSNRPRGGVRVRPEIYSPGTGPADRRFGDLRLQCRVYWPFMNDHLGFIERVAVGALGMCSSSRINLFMGMERTMASASITGRETPPELAREGMSVHLPLAERTISNEARLQLVYR